MKSKELFLTTLFISWIGIIDADRIDLGIGRLGFVATPDLFISFVLIVFYFIPKVLKPNKVSRMNLGSYSTGNKQKGLTRNFFLTILLILFIFTVGFSIISSPVKVLSLKRYVLLTYQIVSTFTLILFFFNEFKEKFASRIVIAAYLGITINLIFSIIELYNWTLGLTFLIDSDSAYFINLIPQTIGQFAPRLSGVCIDPNRNGYLISLYLFLIINFSNQSRLRGLFIFISVLLTLATLSKTSIIALLSLIIVYCFMNFRTIIPDLIKYYVQNLKYIFLFLCLMILPSIVLIGFIEKSISALPDIDFSAVMGERFSSETNMSGGQHFALIEIGIKSAFENLKILLIGNGYGSSYTLIADILGDNIYANFHSVYITFLVEAGLFSLIILSMLMFLPLIWARNYVPILTALATFNMFYQTHASQSFWLSLSLAWYNIPKSSIFHNIQEQ